MPIPTIENGGRHADGSLATATRPITAPTKKIEHITIDENVEVKQPRKPWPHRRFVPGTFVGVFTGIGFFVSWFVIGPLLKATQSDNVGNGTALFVLSVLTLMIVGACAGLLVSRVLRNSHPYSVEPDAPTTA